MPSKLVPFPEGGNKKYCVINPESMVTMPFSTSGSNSKKLIQPILCSHASYAKYSKSTSDLKMEKIEVSFTYRGKSEKSRSDSPTTSISSDHSSTSDNGQDSGVSSEQDISPPRLRRSIKMSPTHSDSDIDSNLSSDSIVDFEPATLLKKQVSRLRGSKKKILILDTILDEIKQKADEMRKIRQAKGEGVAASQRTTALRAKSQRPGRLTRLHSLSSIPHELPSLPLDTAHRYSSMCSLSIDEDSVSSAVSEYGRPMYECPDGEASCGFAGISEIFSPQQDSTIKSAKGTVRGVKNRVRAGIATFTSDHRLLRIYANKERGKVVIYVTTLGVIRETYERCLRLRKILWTLLVRFDEKDIFMARDTQLQLLDRLRERHISVPHVFLEGQYLGGVELIEKLNETGELRRLLQPYMKPANLSTCEACGGFRLLPCVVCSGSKKSVHRNNFTSEFVSLKCSACDESGLVQCFECVNSP